MQEVTRPLTGGQGDSPRAWLTVSMSWGCSQCSHCDQIAEPSKCFEIRMAIPAVQPRQLKQSSREITDGVGQLLAQPLSLEMGHIKVLDEIPQQNCPR